MSASAHIQKFSKNNDGHTEYFIKVVFNGREWAIRKRYSEFIQFDDYLGKSGYKVSYSLPEKTWWKRFDQNVLGQRQKELQSYLDVLLKSTVSTENSLVREFLEVDYNKLAFARRQTVREFTKAENLDTIVTNFRKSVIDIPSKKTLMMSTPVQTRGRQLSVFKRINSLGTGYGSTASKSSSFSNRPLLRRGETVTSDSGMHNSGSNTPSTPTNGRDRRFSIDLFSQMAGSSFKDSFSAAGGGYFTAVPEQNEFVATVDALWPHYAPPVIQAIEDMESGGECPVTCFEPFSDSLSGDIISVLLAPLSIPTVDNNETRKRQDSSQLTIDIGGSKARTDSTDSVNGLTSGVSMRQLERDLCGLIGEMPTYVSLRLKHCNPVHKRLPIDGGRSFISAATDKSDSLSESITHSIGGNSSSSSTRNNSSANDSPLRRMDTNVEGEGDEEQEEEEGSCVSKLTLSRGSSPGLAGLHILGALTPSTSLESLSRL